NIGAITNGVHHLSWVGESVADLYDRELPGWRADTAVLRRASELDDEALIAAHVKQKRKLILYANSQTGRGYSDRLLTIGFARRAAAYNRSSLLFRNLDRLASIAGGRVQFLFAGKAHPRDETGHRIIQAIYQASQSLGSRVRVGFIVNYDIWTGHLITSGA